MPITVITIDFWNTLFDSTGGAARNHVRRATLIEAAAAAGYEARSSELEEAYASIWGYFDDHWLNHHRTPTSEEMVREICRRADVQLGEHAVRSVVTTFERGVLDDPPALLEGAHEALDQLAGRSRLALISDTAFSPGSVLHELMERFDVARFFDAFIFSDETGVAKPHPEAFGRALEQLAGRPADALHIGDIERTDIRGAKDAGMRAVLYRGDRAPHKYSEEATAADAVIDHWNQALGVIESMEPDRA